MIYNIVTFHENESYWKCWNECSVASCIKPYKEVIWIVSWGTTPRLFIYVYLLSDIIRLPYFDARPVKCDTGRWCSVTDNNAKPPFAILPKLLGNFTNLSHTQIFIHMYTIKTRYTDIKWHYNKGRLFSFFSCCWNGNAMLGWTP